METQEFLGQFTLTQSDTCFKLGRDSVLLSHFATVKPGWSVCDLGCGVGSLLLLLSQRQERLTRYGIEIDPIAATLARRNLADNQLDGTIYTGDFRTQDRFLPDSMQLVISNPPYFRQGSGKSGGRARMEEACSVASLCQTAARLLRTGGRFAVVFRPERLSELFCAMEQESLTPKRLQLLCYNRQKAPYAVLVEAIKEGGPGLTILPNHIQEE